MILFRRRALRTALTFSAGALVASAVAALPGVIESSGAGTALCASPAGKCFAVTVTDQVPVAGQAASFVFDVTNDAPQQSLGSIEFTPPPGIALTSVTGPGGGTINPATGAADFLFLNLAPGQNATLTADATVSCGASAGYVWGNRATQANRMRGSGNDFSLEYASMNNLNGFVEGPCSLSLTAAPAPTELGSTTPPFSAPVTSQFKGSAPLTVEAVDGSGNPISGFDSPVTVSLGSPDLSALEGTLTETAAGGTASFGDLSLVPGTPTGDASQVEGVHQLVFSGGGLSGAASFSAYANGTFENPCLAGSSSCTAFDSDNTGQVFVDNANYPNTSGNTEYLAASISPQNPQIACSGDTIVGGPSGVSDPAQVIVYNADGTENATQTVEVRVTIFHDYAQEPVANGDLPCYGRVDPFYSDGFTETQGTFDGVTLNEAELPMCNVDTPVGPPCTEVAPHIGPGDLGFQPVEYTVLSVGDPNVRDA